MRAKCMWEHCLETDSNKPRLKKPFGDNQGNEHWRDIC